MSSVIFYLENWIFPMVVVVLIYLVFLLPIYSWAKKKKIGYWKLIWLSLGVVYLVDGVLFFVENTFSKNKFLAFLFFSSWIINFLFFSTLPYLIKKKTNNKLNKSKVIGSYLLLFLFQIFYVWLFFVWIAIGLANFF